MDHGIPLFWVALLSGAVSGFVGGLASSWATRVLPWMGVTAKAVGRGINFLRKFVLGRKRTRQVAWREFWAARRRLPMWLLRATLFRWYEANPARDWPYVLRVHVEHSAEAVREHARNLLWEERTIEQLRQRDRFSSSKETHHVASIHPCADHWRMVTNADAGRSTHWRRKAGEVFPVNRGWCSNVRDSKDSCHYCDISDEQLERRA